MRYYYIIYIYINILNIIRKWWLGQFHNQLLNDTADGSVPGPFNIETVYKWNKRIVHALHYDVEQWFRIRWLKKSGEVFFPIVSQWVVVFLCFKYGSHIPTMQCSIFPAFSPRLGGSGCPRHVQRAKKNWNPHLVGGFSPPLWKMMDFVSWDDDIPNIIPNIIPNNYHIPNIYIYDYSQYMGKK